MSDSYYELIDSDALGEKFTATDLVRSTWSAAIQHAAPVSALLVRGLERCEQRDDTRLGRNGMTKLSLSQVALQAGVSRPTLYRWFASKKELLDTFVVWERQLYERAVAEATAGLPAGEKLDAVLRVIVGYQQSYPGLRMIDIEPAHVIKRLSHVIPLMRERLERLSTGPDAEVAVATAVRVAISHYLVRSDDDDEFLTQLRHAVGQRCDPPVAVPMP